MTLSSNRVLDIGCWLLDAGCWFLVAGFWFLVSGFWLLVAGFWLRIKKSRTLRLCFFMKLEMNLIVIF